MVKRWGVWPVGSPGSPPNTNVFYRLQKKVLFPIYLT